MDNLQFYKLLEQLIYALTGSELAEGSDPEKVNAVLQELCKMFRICKGESCFYESVNHERLGKGECFVCYDSGEPGVEVMHIRVVTRVMAVVTCAVYMTEQIAQTAPLTDEERVRVDLIMRIVLNSVSKSRLQKVVERLALQDDRGYRNPRFFQRHLAALNEQHKLGRMAAIHFNLRHFALVNQEIGRKAGDVVMRNHINGLERLLGTDGVVCRLGGDNFVSLCARENLESVVSYLNETPVVYDVNFGKRIMVSASAGVYRIPEGFVMRDPGEIMDKIITSLQAARSGGKEHIVFFDDELRLNKERVMRVQQRFPEALRSEKFKVYYQPKINIANGRLAGAEALCRWQHNGRMVSPGEFIPVLEETMDICKLDFYMLDHVCQDIRRWLDEGRNVVRVSVNLSRRHMMDIDLLQNIMEIIDSHNVPHQYIEIELTETTTDVEFRDLKRVVGGLQQAGVYTSVDDFGVGYSSLNLLREIPWNVLKVDRSFLPVEGDDADSARSVMFKYVVAMAKELGLSCIAEGVETQNQLDLLRENHCDLAQGFLFDEPLPVSAFEERLSGYRYTVEQTG